MTGCVVAYSPVGLFRPGCLAADEMGGPGLPNDALDDKFYGERAGCRARSEVGYAGRARIDDDQRSQTRHHDICL